jgi:hypothetical protein
LPENFGFAHHLRFEAGGDFQRMLEDVEIGVPEGMGIEELAADTALGAEVVAHGVFDVRVGGQAVNFQTITGIDDEALADAFMRAELFLECLGLIGRQGEAFTEFEGGFMVRAPEDE